MTDQPDKANSQRNLAGFQKAAGYERVTDRQPYWLGFEHLTNGQRAMLGWGRRPDRAWDG